MRKRAVMTLPRDTTDSLVVDVDRGASLARLQQIDPSKRLRHSRVTQLKEGADLLVVSE